MAKTNQHTEDINPKELELAPKMVRNQPETESVFEITERRHELQETFWEAKYKGLQERFSEVSTREQFWQAKVKELGHKNIVLCNQYRTLEEKMTQLENQPVTTKKL